MDLKFLAAAAAAASAVLYFFYWAWKDASVPDGYKAPKVKPNHPCPCGSGKTYRDCCQAKDLEKQEIAEEREENIGIAFDRKNPKVSDYGIINRGREAFMEQPEGPDLRGKKKNGPLDV
jgi:hypothetical protein